MVVTWSNWLPSRSSSGLPSSSWCLAGQPWIPTWPAEKYLNTILSRHTLTLWWYVGVSEVVSLLCGLVGHCCPTLCPPQDTEGSIQAAKRATTHWCSVKVAICEWMWEGTEWERNFATKHAWTCPSHILLSTSSQSELGLHTVANQIVSFFLEHHNTLHLQAKQWTSEVSSTCWCCIVDTAVRL